MKKLFVLTSILALGALSSFAQGVVNANSLSGSVSIFVSDPAINGGAQVKIGTPASATFGTGLGKGAVSMAMYAAVAGTPIQTLESSAPIWTGFNSVSTLSTQQGSVGPGSGFVLPTATGFDQGAVEFVFYGSATGTLGGYAGWSAVGTTTVITAAAFGGGTTPNTVFGGATGISSFVLVPVPEPATIALGGLGAAALLLFRRRK